VGSLTPGAPGRRVDADGRPTVLEILATLPSPAAVVTGVAVALGVVVVVAVAVTLGVTLRPVVLVGEAAEVADSGALTVGAGVEATEVGREETAGTGDAGAAGVAISTGLGTMGGVATALDLTEAAAVGNGGGTGRVCSST